MFGYMLPGLQCLATFCQDDNVWPLCCQDNTADFGYEGLPHPSHSSSLSPTDYHFVKHVDTFLRPKTFHSIRKVETAFKDFLGSKPLEFYCTGVNNLVNRRYQCIDVKGSYFH